MRLFRAGAGLVLAACCLNVSLLAADFDISPQNGSGSVPHDATQFGDAKQNQGTQSSALLWTAADDVPVWLDAGDVPTAYTLPKYDLRTDFRLYEGGGIMGKAYIGLFSRFFVGGAANLRQFVGPGHLTLGRDDAQIVARLALLTDNGICPALAVGWDGPSYDRSRAKGLYAALSKQLVGDPFLIEVHGGLNAGPDIGSFTPDRDLRADAAVTASFRNYGVFSSLDEMLDTEGPRWNAGLQATFAPITLALEFQDLASVRPDTPVSRVLRGSWNGSF